MPTTLTPAQVRAAAARLSRVPLAHLPTPLEEVPRFAAAVGGGVRILVKRDDCTGLLLGGNKARHNEFLMGDAVAAGADVVVWGGGTQSNNCRQTAAACARLGIECHLYLSRAHGGTEVQGNLLLDHLVGATVAFVDEPVGPALNGLLAAKADELRAAGRTPYHWHPPRVVPLAAVSYTLCLAEIAEQLGTDVTVYVSSSGATGAGVCLGARLLGFPTPRIICPMPWPWSIPDALARDASAAAELMGLPHRLTASDVDADESHIAPGYGEPSAGGREALALLARTEAILLDPTYSAKAMAGLVADVRAGRHAPGSVLVFVHTGGTPAVFADPVAVLPVPPVLPSVNSRHTS
jgi:1-aminocyclopropane-1-carboxylate deaminase/D-cysteine desulfhydrase-like pyridoxal-dependent ACC family enzyme